jgi:hypothetical protein
MVWPLVEGRGAEGVEWLGTARTWLTSAVLRVDVGYRSHKLLLLLSNIRFEISRFLNGI